MDNTGNPETTDYAARAKALIKKAGRAGALVIVPIGLAVQAHASVLLPTPTTCVLGGSGSCNTFVSQLPTQYGLEGVSGSYDGITQAYSSGGGGTTSMSLSASGLLTIDGTDSNCNGVGNPCELSSFLLSWSASIVGYESGQFGENIQSNVYNYYGVYTVTFQLDGATIFSESASATTGTSPGPTEHLSGSASVAIPPEFKNQIANLAAGSSGGNDTLTLTISTDFDAKGSSLFAQPNSYTEWDGAFSVAAEAPPPPNAPEPATTGLALGGLLGLGWLRRRKRS